MPMFGLAKLHPLAAQRGDGLLPELLALFDERQQRLAPDSNVTEIHAIGQAGPNPAGRLTGDLPENVVLFRPGRRS
jgi:hypothetical protein